MSKPITLPAEVIEAMSNNKYNYVSISKHAYSQEKANGRSLT
jgi:hypothetical protein